MPLRVSGKNLDIGESLRAHVLEKIEAIMARYHDGRVSGHVVIAREGSGYRADCALHLSSGVDLQAEGKAQEPYLGFEQALDKIERRLRRYKTRLKTRNVSSESVASEGDDSAAMQVAGYKIEALDDTEEVATEYKPVVVAEGSRPLKSLSVASAVAELDLGGAPVIVFQHAGSARVNVVYRRADGAIGWLDPH
jgi:ribosomal subunit interface protein